MTRISVWLSERPVLLSLVLIVAVTVPGYLSIQNTNNEHEVLIECLNDYGDASALRAETLTPLAQNRMVALDQLIRSVTLQDREVFRARLAEYIEASDAYEQALTDHPVPEAPTLRCGNGGGHE